MSNITLNANNDGRGNFKEEDCKSRSERDRERKVEKKYSFAVGIDAYAVQSLYCGNENSRVSPLVFRQDLRDQQ